MNETRHAVFFFQRSHAIVLMIYTTAANALEQYRKIGMSDKYPGL
jgi:hypothetical protein